jgi:hypothetical protein
MNLLFCISSSQIGGAEKQFVRTVLEVKSEFDVALCILGNPGPYREQYEKLGIPIFASKGSLVSDIWTSVRAIRTHKPQSIVSFLYRSDSIMGVIGKLLRVRHIVISARNTDWPKSSVLKRAVLKYVANRKCDLIIGNSNRAIDFHLGIGYPESKMRCIKNFIDTGLNFRPRKEIRTLGLAARAIEGKGHLTALRVHGELSSISFEKVLTMIGPGLRSWSPLKGYLNNESDQIQIVDGGVDIANWFETIDLYLGLSDTWESDSNSLLEAISRGIPIVTSKIQAIEDVSEMLNIVDVQSVADVTSAIVRILEMSEQELVDQVTGVRNRLLELRNPEATRQSWLQAISAN